VARRAARTEESKLLDEGIAAGKKAVALAPNRVEGHFWLGANYGLAAEAGSFLKGFRLIDDIRNEMQIVLKLNSEYEQAGALLILGRLSLEAPFFWMETSTIQSSCSKRACGAILKTAWLCFIWPTVMWPSVAGRTRANNWRTY
jgi:hypothetical protein